MEKTEQFVRDDARSRTEHYHVERSFFSSLLLFVQCLGSKKGKSPKKFGPHSFMLYTPAMISAAPLRDFMANALRVFAIITR